jgi:hypothetical protein
MLNVIQRSTLIDFNNVMATRTTDGPPPVNRFGQPTKTYNVFQFWNFLDDALSDIRQEAAKESGTIDQQKQWLAR